MVEILSDSLTLSETPMTTKVARLMLASDVLYNSTAPVRNASRYRSLLEACLPDVFESMQVRLPSPPDKLETERKAYGWPTTINACTASHNTSSLSTPSAWLFSACMSSSDEPYCTVILDGH